MKRDNPLALLRLVWRARRPSALTDMHALRNDFWLRPGYEAMTFFGFIVTATQQEADHINGRMTPLKRHEMIHLRQAQSTGNSWLRFYLLYLWYYLRALPQNRRMANAAYRLNPFEIEAYAHMYEPDYLDRPADEWRRWAKLKPRQRLKLFKKCE